jgi:hypothetical protein
MTTGYVAPPHALPRRERRQMKNATRRLAPFDYDPGVKSLSA